MTTCTSSPGRRRLIVHIGTAKAGSTSIQHALAGLAGRLRRIGVHVPRAGRHPALACHNNLAHALNGDHFYRPAFGDWTDLLAEVRHSAAERFVLSAEAFTGRGNGARCAERIARFAADADLDLNIVAYVRPQWQRLEAHYTQVISSGLRTTPFKQFVTGALDGFEDAILDYYAVLAPWQEWFGERVHIWPLELLRLPAGLVAHFVGLVAPGVDASGYARFRRNVRRGSMELEVRRLVCTALGERNVADRMRAMRRLRWLPALLWGDMPFAGLSAAQATALMDRFGPANARVAREYGVDPGGALFRDSVAIRCGAPVQARWADIPEYERRLIRRYVQDRVGADIDPGVPGSAGDRLAVAARTAGHCLRRIAQLPGQWRRFSELRDPRLVAGWMRDFLLGCQ